jgi:DNA polymerase-3 subunit alpha
MLNEYEEDEETGVKHYAEIKDGQQVTMGGMIGAYKKLKTRSGSFMAFISVEDMSGVIECVCFPKVYDRVRSFLETDKVVSLSGRISIEEETLPVIILDKMEEFVLGEDGKPATNQQDVTEDKPAEPNKTVQAVPVEQKADKDKTLWLNVTELDDEDVDELLDTLSYYAGTTLVYFVKNGKKMPCSQRVPPNKALMAELASFLPENCIKII